MQFKVVYNGNEITISVSPTGFVKISNNRQNKSQALVSFARALLTNPSVVETEQIAGGVKIRLGDGSEWVLKVDDLLIVRADEYQISEKGGETVSKENNGATQPKKSRTSKLQETLKSLLSAQGLNEQQINEILSALSIRKSEPQFDESTPEGKLQAAAYKLFKSAKKHNLRMDRFKDGDIEFSYNADEGTYFIIFGGEVVAQWPPANGS